MLGGDDKLVIFLNKEENKGNEIFEKYENGIFEEILNKIDNK